MHTGSFWNGMYNLYISVSNPSWQNYNVHKHDIVWIKSVLVSSLYHLCCHLFHEWSSSLSNALYCSRLAMRQHTWSIAPSNVICCGTLPKLWSAFISFASSHNVCSTHKILVLIFPFFNPWYVHYWGIIFDPIIPTRVHQSKGFHPFNEITFHRPLVLILWSSLDADISLLTYNNQDMDNANCSEQVSRFSLIVYLYPMEGSCEEGLSMRYLLLRPWYLIHNNIAMHS